MRENLGGQGVGGVQCRMCILMFSQDQYSLELLDAMGLVLLYRGGESWLRFLSVSLSLSFLVSSSSQTSHSRLLHALPSVIESFRLVQGMTNKSATLERQEVVVESPGCPNSLRTVRSV